MNTLLKREKNFNSICHPCVSENPVGNKVLHTAGSSGSADAAPRMTESGESGRSTPICHCEEHSATWQSGEIASHSFAMTEQHGRSLVEMLGVLAVMGVLSVAGIAGFNNAMNRYRANELMNEASKRATVVAVQAMMGRTGEIFLGEFGNNSVSGATFGTTAKIENNQIQLTLSGVADSVCAQMKTALGENAIMAVDDTCTTIVFNADMSKGVTIAVTNQDENGFCLKGYVAPECREKVTCSAAQKWTENGCVCNNRKFGANCDSNCNGVYGTLQYEACQSCSNHGSITATQAECDKCPNRTHENDKCNLTTCPYGELKVGYICQSCTDLVYSYPATKAECDKCPNRTHVNGKCRLKSCPTGYAAPTEDYANCVYQVPTNQRCQWSDWMDVSYPHPGSEGGDLETYVNIRAAGGAICEKPVNLEFRSENLSEANIWDIGQEVHLDLNTGLICKNEEQSDPFLMCLNYHIRILCCEDT